MANSGRLSEHFQEKCEAVFRPECDKNKELEHFRVSEKRGNALGADFIRALACMMVLAHHLVLRIDLDRLSPMLRPVFETARFGSYGVSLFFVLSGFLLSRPFWQALDDNASLPSLRLYALRRAARILPGFWTALTVGFVLSVTVYGLPLTGELVLRYVAGFFLMSQWHWRTFFPVQGDGPLWSIPFETTCYLLLPLGFVPLRRLRAHVSARTVIRLGWLGVIALALLGHWLIATFVPMDEAGRGWQFGIQGGAKEWMPRYNPVGFFAVFSLGVLAAGISTRLPRRTSVAYDLIGLIALAGIAAALATSTPGKWEGYGWLGIPYRFPILPLAVALALCSLPDSKWLGAALDNRLTRFIATISFGIYIWQDIVISGLVYAFPGAFGIGTEAMLSGWLAWSAIAIAATFAIGTLSYMLIERPVMQWARRLEKRPALRGQALDGTRAA